MKSLWQKFVSALRRLFGGGQLFVLVWAGITDGTNRTINNAQLQALAREAVKAAAAAGLKGAEARSDAFARCKAALAEIGIELADRLVDTLLQIGYMQFRDLDG